MRAPTSTGPCKRCLVGAFTYSGQVCISVQRLLVHESIWDAFMERFVAGAAALRMGDPTDPATDLGPMVEPEAAARTERWVREAEAEGARVLAGGRADGAWFPPTVIVDAPRCAAGVLGGGVRAARRRVPVRATSRRRWPRSTTAASGSSAASSRTTWRMPGAPSRRSRSAASSSTTCPLYRVDHMPYGGVKDSGLGREGLRWAIEDMTELRLMVVAAPPDRPSEAARPERRSGPDRGGAIGPVES